MDRRAGKSKTRQSRRIAQRIGWIVSVRAEIELVTRQRTSTVRSASVHSVETFVSRWSTDTTERERTWNLSAHRIAPYRAEPSAAKSSRIEIESDRTEASQTEPNEIARTIADRVDARYDITGCYLCHASNRYAINDISCVEMPNGS